MPPIEKRLRWLWRRKDWAASTKASYQRSFERWELAWCYPCLPGDYSFSHPHIHCTTAVATAAAVQIPFSFIQFPIYEACKVSECPNALYAGASSSSSLRNDHKHTHNQSSSSTENMVSRARQTRDCPSSRCLWFICWSHCCCPDYPRRRHQDAPHPGKGHTWTAVYRHCWYLQSYLCGRRGDYSHVWYRATSHVDRDRRLCVFRCVWGC